MILGIRRCATWDINFVCNFLSHAFLVVSTRDETCSGKPVYLLEFQYNSNGKDRFFRFIGYQAENVGPFFVRNNHFYNFSANQGNLAVRTIFLNIVFKKCIFPPACNTQSSMYTYRKLPIAIGNGETQNIPSCTSTYS